MDLLNRRKERRIPVRLRTDMERAHNQFLGFVLDLSEGGFCVMSLAELARGEAVDLVLYTEPRRPIKVQAVVLWERELPLPIQGVAAREAGFQVANPPPEYLELVRETDLAFMERRVDPRYRAVLKVRAEELAEEPELLTANISKGGLFVRAERLPEAGQVLELILELPPGFEGPLRVQGVVVDLCDAFRSMREGRPQGFSIHFNRFKEGDDFKLSLYLDSLMKARQS